MDDRQIIKSHGKQLQEVAVCGLKPPSSCPILIFEIKSKPSLVTFICMDPHLPNN